MLVRESRGRGSLTYEEIKALSVKQARQNMLDEFAMAALPGVSAGKHYTFVEYAAKRAYAIADAMMAERDKRVKDAG